MVAKTLIFFGPEDKGSQSLVGYENREGIGKEEVYAEEDAHDLYVDVGGWKHLCDYRFDQIAAPSVIAYGGEGHVHDAKSWERKHYDKWRLRTFLRFVDDG